MGFLCKRPINIFLSVPRCSCVSSSRESHRLPLSENQLFLPETMGSQQTCWSLEVESTTHNSSYVDKFDPCILKKKKKKNKKKCFGREDDFPDSLVQKAQHLENSLENHVPPSQSGRSILPRKNFGEDYEYRELLNRLLYMLREDNLEVPEEKRRAVMMPPQVLAEGLQNTVCVNFAHLCRMMNRKPDHVMSFLMAEMGTGGSLNQQQQLVMKARVSSKDFEAMFRRYIDVYVICSCCKSPDTALAEENHHLALRCEMCGSVTSIKSGFHSK